MTSEAIQVSPDPVIVQRIEERQRQIQGSLTKIDHRINRITGLQLRPIRRVFKKRRDETPEDDMGDELSGSVRDPTQRKALLARLQNKKAILTFNFSDAPRAVTEQINANRLSFHLYCLRQFLGDPIMPAELGREEIIPHFDFPYDGGRKDQKLPEINEDGRFFRNIDEVIADCRSVVNEGGGTVTLYDTSIPQLQARSAVIIEVLEKFGFATDEGFRRARAVLLADSGMGDQAMNEFVNRHPERPASKFLRDDWNIYFNGKAKGYLRLESQNNKKLSLLCQEWRIPYIITELSYERIGQDSKLSLALHQEQEIIDLINLPVPSKK